MYNNVDPSIRARETSKDSVLKTYRCEYDNIVSLLKPKPTSNPKSISTPNIYIENVSNSYRMKKKNVSKIPIETTNLLKRLEPILREVIVCRLRLQKHLNI